MSAIGRNDPCPCGSGKKYKKCCLAKDGPAPGAFTAVERQSALEGLFHFSRRAEFDEAHAVARADFWGDWMDGRTQDELREALRLDESETAYLEWFVFDFRRASGRTLAEEFLARERRSLRSGETRYLERMRLSHLRPYEIARVRPEEGLDLTDLWTGERLRVQERLGTRQLIPWDLLGARVMLGHAGVPVLDGLPYLYPALAKEEILKRLRRAHRDFKRTVPAGDLTAFFKRHGMLFHHLWLDHVALRPMPRVVTVEGDEVVLARVVFDVKDQGAVAAALVRHPDLRPQDDGSYVWLEAEPAADRRPARRAAREIQVTSMRLGGGEEPRRSLGTVVPGGRRLVFEATSRPRAERGRAMIEALAGSAVVYRATRYEDVGQALKRPPTPAAKFSEIPPEVEAKLVGEYYEQHYRGWLDEPLPALRGRTPRQAAGLKSGRGKVISLLKAMENMAERQRRDGRPAYDFGWMWAALGLERPG
ncbi:MAG: SEC-C metal-binding domain-containing protein [Candidatus Rokuibacteriota bacterium]